MATRTAFNCGEEGASDGNDVTNAELGGKAVGSDGCKFRTITLNSSWRKCSIDNLWRRDDPDLLVVVVRQHLRRRRDDRGDGRREILHRRICS